MDSNGTGNQGTEKVVIKKSGSSAIQLEEKQNKNI